MPATSAGMTSGWSYALVLRLSREETGDRLHNTRRDRQRRVAVGGEIGGTLGGRKLEHMIDAVERHHADARTHAGKPLCVLHRHLQVGRSLQDQDLTRVAREQSYGIVGH